MRAVLATGFVLALSSAASAAPIPFAGGLLDGVLRTYDIVSLGPSGYDLVLLHDYVLGTDFYPAVPLSFLNTATPYSRCVGEPTSKLPECTLTEGPSVLTGGLGDGCLGTVVGPDHPLHEAIMVLRGNCSFSQKWESAESENWGGVMVVNDAPGPVGPIAIVVNPSFEPTIAFMRLTQEVGDQIGADRRNHAPLLFEIRVSWTPNADTVATPEPGTLVLTAVGLAAAWRQRARRLPLNDA